MRNYSPEEEHALSFDNWPEIPCHIFDFHKPDELINGTNFQDAWWGDLNIPEGFIVKINGLSVKVSVFGFQELRGKDAEVKKHLERSWEIIYPLSGSAVMSLQLEGQEENQIPLNGVISSGELNSSRFGITKNGQLIGNYDRINKIDPVITPAGAIHGTVGNLIYLIVKGMPAETNQM